MSEMSSQCYLLTYSGMYCLYPHLFLASKCIRVRQDIFPSVTPYIPFYYYGFGLCMQRTTFNPTINAHTPCLESCSAYWGSTVNTKGIHSFSSFRWGGILGKLDRGDKVSMGDGFDEDDEYLWKIDGAGCCNPSCQNYERLSDLTGRLLI